MIQIYTGVPGSGKSYKMVHDLAAFLKKDPDITVISNIRNLKLAHVDFDELLDELFPGLKRSQKVESFFNFEHQQALGQQYGGAIMYVLDECQLYFPRRTVMPQTEEYFQRHRHLGHYIFLATQGARLINANLIPLIELEYHAARRTISFFGEIHYKEKSPQSPQVIRKIIIRPKQEIFDLYQSFETAEIKKPRPMLFKFFIIPLLFLPIFYWFYNKYMKPPVKEEKRIEQSVGAAVTDYQKVVQERDRLVLLVSNLQTDNESLKLEVNRLKRNIEQKVRVFLPIVKVGDRRLTVDPESNAVVDVSMIRKQMTCIGDHCYYDKPMYGGVQLVSDNPRHYGSVPVSPIVKNPPISKGAEDSSGIGSFVEPSMVPPPERIRSKVYNGLSE